MSYVYSGKLMFNIVFKTMTATGPVYDVIVEHPTIGQVFKGAVALTQKEESMYRKYDRLYENIALHILDRILDIQAYAERQFRSDGDGPNYRITRTRADSQKSTRDNPPNSTLGGPSVSRSPRKSLDDLKTFAKNMRFAVAGAGNIFGLCSDTAHYSAHLLRRYIPDIAVMYGVYHPDHGEPFSHWWAMSENQNVIIDPAAPLGAYVGPPDNHYQSHRRPIVLSDRDRRKIREELKQQDFDPSQLFDADF